MSTCKITYNGSEISSVEETAPVIVTYGGNQIARISDGESKTLNCNGLYMTGNVVAGSKTMNCANKVMASDVVISVEGSAVSGETWYFNYDVYSYGENYDCIFTSGEEQFVGIFLNADMHMTQMGYVKSDGTIVDAYYWFMMSGTTWYKDSYRTITLDSPATGKLLSWLQENATKIS